MRSTVLSAAQPPEQSHRVGNPQARSVEATGDRLPEATPLGGPELSMASTELARLSARTPRVEYGVPELLSRELLGRPSSIKSRMVVPSPSELPWLKALSSSMTWRTSGFGLPAMTGTSQAKACHAW